MESPKIFGGLLTVVVKHLFEGASAENLKEDYFADVEAATPEALSALFETCKEVISQAAVQDLEITQFEALVQKESSLSAAQQDLFVKFWRAQKAKIHENVYKQTRWNNSLTKIAWRIDVKTRTKTAADLNEPTAIVELTTDSGKKQKLIRFEMDKEKLAHVLQQINSIQEQLISKVST
eukprot:Phypoly_transcript_21778.p1 GENE.Phypoly_transcript_21778~~Phypoly_transcript_21778.p1  ORF type:complete len:179 (+),score=35.15 Phypoly_transcript_21778:62-598(+)